MVVCHTIRVYQLTTLPHKLIFMNPTSPFSEHCRVFKRQIRNCFNTPLTLNVMWCLVWCSVKLKRTITASLEQIDKLDPFAVVAADLCDSDSAGDKQKVMP